MSAPRAARQTGRLAAAAHTARARLRHGRRRAALGSALAAGLGACAGMIAGAPAFASGEAGGSPGLTNAAAGVWCPTLHKRASLSAGEPVTLTPGVGSTQSTEAGAQFPLRLAVTATDDKGNPVPGVSVTFSAPPAGASGRFTTYSRGSHHDRSRASHPRTVRVETDACGIAVAPVFTASRQPGGYVVKASVEHLRPAAFALVNEAS